MPKEILDAPSAYFFNENKRMFILTVCFYFFITVSSWLFLKNMLFYIFDYPSYQTLYTAKTESIVLTSFSLSCLYLTILGLFFKIRVEQKLFFRGDSIVFSKAKIFLIDIGFTFGILYGFGACLIFIIRDYLPRLVLVDLVFTFLSFIFYVLFYFFRVYRVMENEKEIEN